MEIRSHLKQMNLGGRGLHLGSDVLHLFDGVLSLLQIATRQNDGGAPRVQRLRRVQA